MPFVYESDLHIGPVAHSNFISCREPKTSLSKTPFIKYLNYNKHDKLYTCKTQAHAPRDVRKISHSLTGNSFRDYLLKVVINLKP